MHERCSRFVIVAAGGLSRTPQDNEYIRDIVSERDILVAANGGSEVLLNLGMKPDVVIGDLDSISSELINQLPPKTDIHKHPADKDKTDSHLAVDWVIEQTKDSKEKTNIIICGGLGNRFDHSLALIFYCMKLVKSRNLSISLTDGQQMAYYVKDKKQISGHEGDTISLIPLSESVTDIHLKGFQYCLSGESMKRADTLGVSNVICNCPAEIQIAGEGILLIIHHFKGHT